MIFIDSNVPMHLVGATHPNKTAARLWLETAIRERITLVTDAEVLQEILHRYVAINRRDAIAPAIDILLQLVDDVLPITRENVLQARDLVVGELRRKSARDALHIAVMRDHGIKQILTFDRDFDGLPDIARARA